MAERYSDAIFEPTFREEKKENVKYLEQMERLYYGRLNKKKKKCLEYTGTVGYTK